MKAELKNAEAVFFEVLLEKLTSPGVLMHALEDHPSEHIFFAVVSIAFHRWQEMHGLEDQEELFQPFFRLIDRKKEKALSIISAQRANRSSSANPQ